MKNLLLILLGFAAGVFATLALVYVLYVYNQPNDGIIGLSRFPEKGECIPTKRQLKVFQVWAPGMALARSGEYSDELLLFLINEEDKTYYDNQKINIPAKQCARQVGTFQYTTRMGIEKTVPAVVIE